MSLRGNGINIHHHCYHINHGILLNKIYTRHCCKIKQWIRILFRLFFFITIIWYGNRVRHKYTLMNIKNINRLRTPYKNIVIETSIAFKFSTKVQQSLTIKQWIRILFHLFFIANMFKNCFYRSLFVLFLWSKYSLLLIDKGQRSCIKEWGTY
jgi:hypothetical protein